MFGSIWGILHVFIAKVIFVMGSLHAWLQWQSGIVCVSMSLGSKVKEIINFRNSRMTKSNMAAKWTPWDISSPC